MERPISGFVPDGGEWIAELACGHSQHVRHKPPFWSRPWVLTEEGRAGKVGLPLDCLLCDQRQMPAGYVAYKKTPEFDQDSVPDGLKKHHSTKHGVWGRIHVIAGSLRYVTEPPLAREQILEPGVDGIVIAEVLHHVEPLGPVRFYVEFYRPAAT